MNPIKLLDENAFLAALLVLSGSFAAYRFATYPPPRPTERVAAFAEQPAAEDETVVRVKLETLTRKDAERLNGKLVVATFIVGTESYTWGEGDKLITVTGPRPTQGDCSVHLKGDRLDDASRGRKITVVGTLRVVKLPAATIDGKSFGAVTDVRIVEQ